MGRSMIPISIFRGWFLVCLVMADWSKLPYDIIHKVSGYLTFIEDILAFSAVCCSWRSVYLEKQWHPGPQIPFLMFSDYENSSLRSFMSLYSNKVYNSELPETSGKRCWGSSTGWLVTMGSDLKIHLLNPFTRVSVSLPPLSSLQIHFGEVLDWYDKIERAYVFRKPCTLKENEQDLVVMIIYGPLKQLAFCRPDYSSWRGIKKSIKDAPCSGYIGVACVEDQIFALSDMGLLVVIDIDNQAVVVIHGLDQFNHAALLPHWDWEELFLVESSGNLWMVIQYRVCNLRRYSMDTIRFLIYSYDFTKMRWIRLSNLGNHTVFVGSGCAVSISGAECMNGKSDSVYFVGTNTEQRSYREVHVEVGVYSMASGSSVPLSYDSDALRSYNFPLWVTPTLR